MKRIGITTMYTDSVNYGALLQAYALCRVFRNMGYEAEQIRFRTSNNSKRARRMETLRTESLKEIMKLAGISARARYHAFIKKVTTGKKFDERNKSFEVFRDSIPHSQEIFETNSMDIAEQEYDYFAAGSDQIWFPGGYEPPYYLEFVHEKPKFSYAASMAVDKLTEEEKVQYRERLKDFIGVSVREESGIRALEGASPVPVQQVLDPTLMLSAEQWDEVCAERLISEDYIFCYYLGDDMGARELTTAFAARMGLKIVTLPYLLGEYRKCDLRFGDVKLYDVSPNRFLSLIKHASFVFTDSFHASVFSIIYNRKFFVFKRKGHANMTSRIVSLLNLVSGQDSFCDTEEKRSLDYLVQNADVSSIQDEQPLTEMRKKSNRYLSETLAAAERLGAVHERENP